MIEELANEIVDELGWAFESDEEREELFNRVLDWLALDNDDGSSAIELAQKFDAQLGALG